MSRRAVVTVTVIVVTLITTGCLGDDTTDLITQPEPTIESIEITSTTFEFDYSTDIVAVLSTLPLTTTTILTTTSTAPVTTTTTTTPVTEPPSTEPPTTTTEPPTTVVETTVETTILVTTTAAPEPEPEEPTTTATTARTSSTSRHGTGSSLGWDARTWSAFAPRQRRRPIRTRRHSSSTAREVHSPGPCAARICDKLDG